MDLICSALRTAERFPEHGLVIRLLPVHSAPPSKEEINCHIHCSASSVCRVRRRTSDCTLCNCSPSSREHRSWSCCTACNPISDVRASKSSAVCMLCRFALVCRARIPLFHHKVRSGTFFFRVCIFFCPRRIVCSPVSDAGVRRINADCTPCSWTWSFRVHIDSCRYVLCDPTERARSDRRCTCSYATQEDSSYDASYLKYSLFWISLNF